MPELNRPSAVPADSEDFEALLQQHLPSAMPRHRGELIEATVVRALDDVVLLNYGSKEEAAVPAAEFMGPQNVLTVKPGDTVRLQMVGHDDDGNIKFSYRKARMAEAGEILAKACEAGVPVQGIVTKALPSGVLVDVGIPAFMPASQADVRRIENLETLVGQSIEAYVLEYDEEKGRAVLSRRKLLAERQGVEKEKFLENLTPGQTVKGKVREVLDFGAFIDLGAVQGLLPRSEISYERGAKIEDHIVAGQDIELKVVEVARDSGRVVLSRKRLGEDPWTNAVDRFGVGTTVAGKVVSVQSFGAFVQLEEGITGLIHIKDVSWDSERKAADEVFHEGDQVTCQVTEVDPAARRIALSLKHLSRDPWLDVAARYPVGSRQHGVITRLAEYGAFVKLDDNVEGLVHIGDITWERRLSKPDEMLAVDQETDVTVLSHDTARRRISLGIKQLTGSPFEKFTSENPVGSRIKARVSRLMAFGAFVELAPGLEGLIHISELDENRVDSPERVVRVGEEIEVKILETNKEKNRIGLSRKEAIRDEERDNIRQYTTGQQAEESKSQGSFAAALQAAMGKNK